MFRTLSIAVPPGLLLAPTPPSKAAAAAPATPLPSLLNTLPAPPLTLRYAETSLAVHKRTSRTTPDLEPTKTILTRSTKNTSAATAEWTAASRHTAVALGVHGNVDPVAGDEKHLREGLFGDLIELRIAGGDDGTQVLGRIS